MATLPQRYLQKKGGQWKLVRLMDILVLLHHIYQAAADDTIGFEDAQETLDSITRKLNKKVFIDPAVLESGLWACNMLNEKQAFRHPRGYTFDQFVAKVVGKDTFDKVYNTLERKN